MVSAPPRPKPDLRTTQPVFVEVTRQHMDNGKQKDDTACPVSLAVLDYFDDYEGLEVSTGWTFVVVYDREENYTYYFDHDRRVWIQGYDAGSDYVGPMTVTLMKRREYAGKVPNL